MIHGPNRTNNIAGGWEGAESSMGIRNLNFVAKKKQLFLGKKKYLRGIFPLAPSPFARYITLRKNSLLFV